MTETLARTVFEIYQQNGSTFPFWVSNDRPRHWVMLCRGFCYSRSVLTAKGPKQAWVDLHPSKPGALTDRRYAFIGDPNTLNKQRLNSSGVLITAHNFPGWLPA